MAMAIPAPDHANDTLSAHSETITATSQPGETTPIAAPIDPLRQRPSSSRAGFVPIASEEGNNSSVASSELFDRAIVLASDIQATTPEVADNPFQAEAFDFGQDFGNL
ncbi:MAG: hypothetical protein EAZ61_07255, partial [Oscillatoriales cyanobacterium]